MEDKENLFHFYTEAYYFIRLLGYNDPREAAKYIQQRFENLNRSNSRKIYTRIMSVLKDVEAVKELVEDIIETTAKKLPKSK